MEDENPYAAPQADLESTDFAIEGDLSVVRVGEKLRMPEGSQLPTRCVKCNRPANTEWEVAVSNGLSSQSGATAILFVMLGVVLLMVFVFYDISLLWLIPLVIFAVGIVWWMERNEPRPACTTFYICPTHNYLRVLGFLPLFVIVPLILGSSWLSEWTGFDVDEILKYPRMMFAIVFANIMLAFVPRLVGKKLENGLFEFHGFGKKFLDNFPQTEERQSVEPDDT